MELLTIAYWTLIFVCAIYVLVRSADIFMDATEDIGAAMKIPPFILGATLVAVGTSLPELITSTVAVWKGSTEIVVGNVVGSNVSNILLIIGISIFMSKRFIVPFRKLQYDFLILLASSLVLAWFIASGNFGKVEGLICLLLLAAFLAYTIVFHRDSIEPSEHFHEKHYPAKSLVLFLLSGLLITTSAKFTVDSIVHLSEFFNVGAESIALTALALGTSLPELVVSIAAAKRNATEIIIGNILGSNVFNTFAVMGIPALIKPLAIPEQVQSFSLPMMLLATFLFVILSYFNRTTIPVGVLFLILYVIFILGIFLGVDLFELLGA